VIKYKSDGSWFDEGTIARLIDDYRSASPPLDCGLFIGFVDGIIDEEVCIFEEFEEVEISDMNTELDVAFEFQDIFWKKADKK